MLTILKGDVIEAAHRGDIDVLVHGCNCQGIMGAGIAKAIATEWPEVLRADQVTNKSIEKCGSILPVLVTGRSHNRIIVVNAYTQPYPGPYADVAHLRNCFTETMTLYSHLRIGVPLIGAGLGGLTKSESIACMESWLTTGTSSRVTLYLL